MKLEIKHLAPYLPYGLKLINEDYEYDMDAILTDGTIWLGDQEDSFGDKVEDCKPILKPLKSFSAKDFLKMEKSLSDMWSNECDEFGYSWSDDFNPNKFLSKAPFCIVQYLIENHYDIYGLIEAGLAVDYYKKD